MYATARDWARFGEFLRLDGVWRGERLLPEGWVEFLRTPAPASGGQYGAHVWLEVGEFFRGPSRPALPRDAFHAIGHEGQFVSVIPSRELVVVRLGLTSDAGAWDHEGFLAGVLSALPP
jgi:CubicO group peptidase (beta-lactamase class C family)